MHKHIITKAVDYLEQTYQPKIIILYGSFGLGTSRVDSDIDMLVFAEVAEFLHDSTKIENHILDAWIHPISMLEDFSHFLHILPCTVLIDHSTRAHDFIARIEQRHIEQKRKMTPAEKQQLLGWIEKMFQRAQQNTPEGNYRYLWLVYDFPEIYCKLSGQNYQGPIKTIQHLKQEAPLLYLQYEHLLQLGKDLPKLYELYKQLINLE